MIVTSLMRSLIVRLIVLFLRNTNQHFVGTFAYLKLEPRRQPADSSIQRSYAPEVRHDHPPRTECRPARRHLSPQQSVSQSIDQSIYQSLIFRVAWVLTTVETTQLGCPPSVIRRFLLLPHAPGSLPLHVT